MTPEEKNKWAIPPAAAAAIEKARKGWWAPGRVNLAFGKSGMSIFVDGLTVSWRGVRYSEPLCCYGVSLAAIAIGGNVSRGATTATIGSQTVQADGFDASVQQPTATLQPIPIIDHVVEVAKTANGVFCQAGPEFTASDTLVAVSTKNPYAVHGARRNSIIVHAPFFVFACEIVNPTGAEVCSDALFMASPNWDAIIPHDEFSFAFDPSPLKQTVESVCRRIRVTDCAPIPMPRGEGLHIFGDGRTVWFECYGGKVSGRTSACEPFDFYAPSSGGAEKIVARSNFELFVPPMIGFPAGLRHGNAWAWLSCCKN